MYWWNVNALAEDLKADKVSEVDKFLYYFLDAALTAIAPIVAILNKTPHALHPAIATFIIMILGIYICYLSNRKGDNKNFIERIVSISLPISIRIVIYFALVYLILHIIILATTGVALHHIKGLPKGYYSNAIKTMTLFISDFSIPFIALALYYWVNQKIKYIAGSK